MQTGAEHSPPDRPAIRYTRSAQIRIGRRFNGPPDSGNGGYVAGLMAQHLPGPAEVTLHRPIPLDTALDLRPDTAGAWTLAHGSTTLATAREVSGPIPGPPARPTVAEATRAGRASRCRNPAEHPFPGCFVCGSGRLNLDGLRIIPGPLDAQGHVADVWVPNQTAADARGRVRPEFLWSALDCPGGHAAILGAGMYRTLLGRITAEIFKPAAVGQPIVCLGWVEERDGRKVSCGSALLLPDGSPLAAATAIWIGQERP